MFGIKLWGIILICVYIDWSNVFLNWLNLVFKFGNIWLSLGYRIFMSFLGLVFLGWLNLLIGLFVVVLREVLIVVLFLFVFLYFKNLIEKSLLENIRSSEDRFWMFVMRGILLLVWDWVYCVIFI